jgi:hypothetical protein
MITRRSWISVPLSKIYRKKILRPSTSISFQRKIMAQEGTQQPFKNSNFLFNENEIQFLEKHSNEPSKLQFDAMKWTASEIREKTKFNEKSSDQKFLKHDLQCDEVIYTRESENNENVKEKKENFDQIIHLPSVKPEDINENVWNYCSKMDTKIGKIKTHIKEVNGEIDKSNTFYEFHSRGKQKIQNTLKYFSKLERPEDFLKRERIMSLSKRELKQNFNSEIRLSYTGNTMNHHMYRPRFLENADFSQLIYPKWHFCMADKIE